MSPSPVQVAKAVDSVMRNKVEDAYLQLERWNEEIEKTRDNCSKLLGVQRDGVWFVNSTSDGMSIIANGIDWERGDNVVMPDIEFPSNVYPFLRKKDLIEVRYARASYEDEGVEVPLEEVETLVDDHTKVLCVSAVDFAFGIKYDLKRLAEIAHPHNAMFVVDGSQAVGAVRMKGAEDMVDVITLGGQKWTLAPSAGGIFYMNPKLIEKFRPSNVGWMSIDSPKDQLTRQYTEHFEFAKDARRFATGHLNFPGIIGLGASSKYLLDVGITEIQNEIEKLTTYLIRGLDELGFRLLTPRNPRHRAGIVSFAIDNPQSVIEFLKGFKIIVSGASQTKGRGVRVSPDFYNTEAEVHALLRKLRQLLEERTPRKEYNATLPDRK